MKKKKYWLPKMVSSICLVVLLTCILTRVSAEANSKTVTISAASYKLDDKSNFVVNENSEKLNSSAIELTVSGDITSEYEENGIFNYTVGKGRLDFHLSFLKTVNEKDSGGWELSEEKSKEVYGIKLDSKVGNGTIIIQSSKDGNQWFTDKVIADCFSENGFKNPVYSGNEIQLANRCFYRVIVAYRMQKQLEDKRFMGVKLDNFEYAQHLEMFQFSAQYDNAAAVTTNGQKRNLGSVEKVETNKGYTGTKTIGKDDPHYSWEIGYFTVTDFTKVIDQDVPVFLKEIGDNPTLSFNLIQDISKLNDDESLSIAEDAKGYDQYFQTPPTNFKHGALIVKYTNEQNESRTNIYTDFLAASATTGADTRIQLYEEGDYEIALDYKIKKDSLLNSYTDYRIFFKFSVRNGNCMIFPMDIETGSELSNNDYTPYGFKLDFAKSKYLTINVEKISIKKGDTGLYSEDSRFNRAAREDEEYTEPGIYRFIVTNDFTEAKTTKTIYVGENKVIRALAQNHLSVDELNKLLAGGAKIYEDGTIFPVK